MKLAQRIVKWGGAGICILLLLLSTYSTRRAVMWTSPSLEYHASVMHGAVWFAWRPASWNLESDPYAGQAGWSIAETSGVWFWWFATGAVSSWEWVSIPLWLPGLLLALSTGLLWYRDRRNVRRAFRRAVDWLRPVRRKRFTFWLVAAFSVIHVVLVILSYAISMPVYEFFDPPWQIGGRRFIHVFFDWAIPAAIWPAPLWAILWAWLYVRLLNQLGERSTLNRCFECGYDLTGNVSGVCPECGVEVQT